MAFEPRQGRVWHGRLRGAASWPGPPRWLVLLVAAAIPVLLSTAWLFPHGPNRAEVVWRGDYETGDWSQWNHDNLQVVTGGSATLESSNVRQGGHAAVFTTPPFDGEHRSRSQIYLSPSPSYGNEGQENWFGWSTMIGRGSRLEDGSWNNLVSFHQPWGGNLPAPDHFAVTNRRGVWTLRLDAWGGAYNDAAGTNRYRRAWNLGRIRPGTWYDVVFHVRWSADPSAGFVEVWVNGRHVLPLRRAATLYAGDRYVYLKVGYDGGGASGPTTVYNDGTVIAGNQAGALTAFRGGAVPTTTATVTAPAGG